MTQVTIVILSSLDTKAAESEYLRQCLTDFGAETVLVDAGYGGPAKMRADVTAGAVAAAAGARVEDFHAGEDTHAATEAMTQGATACVLDLVSQGRCDGIVSFGGVSNTTLASRVMSALPIGLPKLLISSAAAMPAHAARFFGAEDITMMHAMVDFSGLNVLTRAFLKRGAGAICGMARASDGPVTQSADARLIALTTFRFSDSCSRVVSKGLEALGYTVIPFHAQGVGENAMEDLIAQGLFAGVVDLVPSGLSEQMLGGNRAARPDRLDAAAKAGIPQILTPCGFDMISCGPIERRDTDDPVWQERRLAERALSITDRFRVQARTTAEEVRDIAGRLAEKLNRATAPAAVLVPTRGWSTLSVSGGDLYDPDTDAVFVEALRAALDSTVPVTELELEIDAEAFGQALVNTLHRMIEEQTDAPPPT